MHVSICLDASPAVTGCKMWRPSIMRMGRMHMKCASTSAQQQLQKTSAAPRVVVRSTRRLRRLVEAAVEMAAEAAAAARWHSLSKLAQSQRQRSNQQLLDLAGQRWPLLSNRSVTETPRRPLVLDYTSAIAAARCQVLWFEAFTVISYRQQQRGTSFPRSPVLSLSAYKHQSKGSDVFSHPWGLCTSGPV